MTSTRQDSKQGKHPPSNKKMSLVALAILAILSIILLIILEVTIAKTVITNEKNKLLPKAHLDFYRQHYQTVNHLKGINESSTTLVFPSPESLIYSKIGSGEKNILIQGDSWAEQFASSEFSYKKLKAFAKNNDVEFTLAGTSSYSPSLMTAQLQLLRQKFSISAENIISVFDQTDLGDELCRYKDKRIKGNSGIEVRPFNESDSLEVYNMTNYFRIVDILQSDDFNLVKLFLISKNQLSKLFSRENELKCPWQKITEPLRFGLNAIDSKYMIGILNEYIEEVFTDPKIKKLIVITVPHQGHLNGFYKFDIKELLEIVIADSTFKRRIIHIRVDNQTLLNYKRGNPYEKGDLASHLNDLAHAEIVTQEILNRIK